MLLRTGDTIPLLGKPDSDQRVKTRVRADVTRAYALSRTGFMSIPISLIRLIPAAEGFIGAVIMSHISYNALAANALISATQATVMSALTSPFFYLNIEIGEHIKLSRQKFIGRVVQQGLILSLLLSVVALGLFLSSFKLLEALGQNEELVKIVRDYFNAYSWGVPAVMLGSVYRNYAFATKKIELRVTVGVIGLVLYTGLAYGLAFGKGAFPNAGVSGLGYASAIGAWVNLFHYVFRLVISDRSRVEHKLFVRFTKKRMDTLVKLLRKGAPIIISMLSEFGAMYFCTLLIGSLGKSQLAAEQILSQYQLIFYSYIVSLSRACNINIVESQGHKKNIREYTKSALSLGVRFMGLMTLFCVIFYDKYAGLFLHDDGPDADNTMDIIRNLFILCGFAQICDAIRNIVSGALRGLSDMVIPMFINIVSVWAVGVPLAYLLSFKADWGILGVNAGIGLGFLTGAISQVLRFNIVVGKIKEKADVSSSGTSVASTRAKLGGTGETGELSVVHIDALGSNSIFTNSSTGERAKAATSCVDTFITAQPLC